MVIDRATGGLYDKHIAAANGFVDRNGNFAVGKLLYIAVANFQTKFLSNALGKCRVGIAAEHFDFFPMCNHR